MPLPDTIQTYTYYLTQIASMKLAYVQLVRYLPGMDEPLDLDTKKVGKEGPNRDLKRGTPHDVLAVYGGLFKSVPSSLKDHAEEMLRGSAMPKPEFDTRNPTPTRVFMNGSISPEEAENMIAQGTVDAVVFGKLWIGNPDLQRRIERDAAVNNNPDVKTFYGRPHIDLAIGYTDYPEMKL